MTLIGWKLVEWVEKVVHFWNGCKLLEIAGHGWKRLEIVKIAKIGLTWVAIIGNGWKWLE